jgi:hypothetical protein
MRVVTGEPYYGGDETATPSTTDYGTTYSGAGTTNTGQSATDKLSNKASQVADQVQSAAAPVVDQAKQAVSQAADQAKTTATSALANQKNSTAQTLSSVSNAVDQVSNQLRQNDQTAPYAHYVDMVGDQVQRAANYLQNHDIRQIVGEVQDFARREPALFLGGTFVLGLLAARFLKSSPQSQQNYNQQGWSNQNRSYGGGYNRSYGGYGTYGSYGNRFSSPNTYPPATGYSRGGNYGTSNYGTGSYGTGAPNTTGGFTGTSGASGANRTGAPSTSRSQSGSYTPGSAYGQSRGAEDVGTYDPGSQGIDVREVRP